ncbi:unnamed protein product [Acanthosepion pharaonis]|uniref:Timeless n=1 Tax=Acanthosepion pharaonis TaxID=158019 RepID=A0A812D4X7_ACAPH|nr:unnamed protein product [Sepia pharaonis]
MEWNLMNADGIRNLRSGLGSKLGEDYIIAEECEDTLKEIIFKLQIEDSLKRDFRRQKNILYMIHSDIIPILNSTELTEEIFALTLKLLSNLTQSLDCLFPSSFQRNSMNSEIMDSIVKLLQTIKLLFCQQENLDRLFYLVKPIIRKGEDKEIINQFLLLVRNLLYIQVWDRLMGPAEIQCKFIKNMFECELDEILLSLLTHPSRICWGVIIVQTLSLLYTDQSVLAGLNLPESKLSEDIIFNAENCEVISVMMEADRNIASRAPVRDHIRSQLVVILKSFNSRFLMSGFSGLVSDLKDILISKDCNLDGSYFMWLVMFFLRISRVLEMDFAYIKDVISVDVVGFLVLHFTIASIKELLKTLETYDNHLYHSVTSEDRKAIKELKKTLINMTDMRQLFLFLIRNSQNQRLSFVRDVIVTNHTFLLLLDRWIREDKDASANFEMIQHINQFASISVMQQYARLLENFDNNSTAVNDNLCDESKFISNEAGDLMEYVIHKFMTTAAEDPGLCAKYLFSMEMKNLNIDMNDEDHINDANSDMSVCSNSEFSSVIHHATSSSSSYFKDETEEVDENIMTQMLEKHLECLSDESIINFCVQKLHEDGLDYQLLWLQTFLLETCFIRYVGMTSEKCQVEEPVPLYFSLQNKDIPLIPYNDRQEEALNDKFFCLLLKYLGFKSGNDSSTIFPRIPKHLTAEQLLSKAREMGNIKCANMAESKCPESLRYQQMQMKRVYGLHSKLVDVLENGDASSKRWIHRMLSLNIMDIFEKTDNERKNITEVKAENTLSNLSTFQKNVEFADITEKKVISIMVDRAQSQLPYWLTQGQQGMVGF